MKTSDSPDSTNSLKLISGDWKLTKLLKKPLVFIILPSLKTKQIPSALTQVSSFSFRLSKIIKPGAPLPIRRVDDAYGMDLISSGVIEVYATGETEVYETGETETYDVVEDYDVVETYNVEEDYTTTVTVPAVAASTATATATATRIKQ